MDQIEDLHESRTPTVIGVVTFVLTVATIAVALRVYTRAFILRQMGIDDWTAVLTLILVIVCSFTVAWNIRYGFASHVYTLDGPTITLYLRTFFVSIVFYSAALMGVKMTFLFQYYRILGVQNMRWVIIIATVIVGGWSLSQLLVQLFICQPINAFWDAEAAKTGKCIPNIPQWYINAGGNILTDILIFVLPLPVIGKLNLQKGQRLILLGIFCLGFFTCTISLVRIKYLKLTEDFTWDNVDSACWSIGELASGITCACLPTLRPLVGKFFPHFGKPRAYGTYGRGTILRAGYDPELAVAVAARRNNSDADSRRELTRSYRLSDPSSPISSLAREELYKGYELGGGGAREMKSGRDSRGGAGAWVGMGGNDLGIRGSDSGEFCRLRPDHGGFLQTEITAGGGPGLRPDEEGTIQVDCEVVQVTSMKGGMVVGEIRK